MSFYRNIVRKNVVCDEGLNVIACKKVSREPLFKSLILKLL